MNRYLPDNSYPLRKKRRNFPRLRHLLLVIVLLAAWFLLAPGSKDKDVVSSRNVPAAKAAIARTGTGKASSQTAAQPGTAVSSQSPVQAKPATLTKDDLVHISEDLIKNRNLTIDWELQQFITDMSARYRLYHGAVVVMDSKRGDILAAYGKSTSGEDCTLALNTEIAASIFKLVTATAAIEQKGFRGDTRFFYTGKAHTLYKRQLTNKRDRWCADVTLTDAFARSNNIVFGKLGIIYLGEAPITLTARKLGFGQSPLRVFESPASVIFSPRDDYNLAELACGFNKETRISPLHAAEMVTPALNGGYMVKPRLVRTEKDERVPVMRAGTADSLRAMMEKTVKSGTVAKSFRGVSSDRVLKHLALGGKSGSIDGDNPKGRRNWFVGFARNRDTGEAITIGCALVLSKRFRIHADMLSKLIIREYFSRDQVAMQAAVPAAKGRDRHKRS